MMVTRNVSFKTKTCSPKGNSESGQTLIVIK